MSPPHRPDKTLCKYIDPNFGDDTCQGGKKSSLFWLKKIPVVYPNLPQKDKILFLKDMKSQAHGSLHKGEHKAIWSLLYNLSKDDKGVCNHVWKLRKAYTMKNKTFKCTCGSEINQEALKDIKDIDTSASLPPLKKQKKDEAWVNIVNPHFGDTTCEGAEKSSLFWLGKIKEEFSNLSTSKKVKFIQNMSFHAHACLHKDYHKTIIAALIAGVGDVQKFLTNKWIPELEKTYDALNLKFECTCGLDSSDKALKNRKAQESCINKDSPGTKTKDEIEIKHKPPREIIVNPYLGDSTCKGSEKSSLFWLGKIKEEYSNLGNKKKIKFVQDMISQVHACLHKDSHRTIISELKAGMDSGPPGGPKKLEYLNNNVIPKLEIEYHNINMNFVCTCGS